MSELRLAKQASTLDFRCSVGFGPREEEFAGNCFCLLDAGGKEIRVHHDIVRTDKNAVRCNRAMVHTLLLNLRKPPEGIPQDALNPWFQRNLVYAI